MGLASKIRNRGEITEIGNGDSKGGAFNQEELIGIVLRMIVKIKSNIRRPGLCYI